MFTLVLGLDTELTAWQLSLPQGPQWSPESALVFSGPTVGLAVTLGRCSIDRNATAFGSWNLPEV